MQALNKSIWPPSENSGGSIPAAARVVRREDFTGHHLVDRDVQKLGANFCAVTTHAHCQLVADCLVQLQAIVVDDIEVRLTRDIIESFAKLQ